MRINARRATAMGAEVVVSTMGDHRSGDGPLNEPEPRVAMAFGAEPSPAESRPEPWDGGQTVGHAIPEKHDGLVCLAEA